MIKKASLVLVGVWLGVLGACHATPHAGAPGNDASFDDALRFDREASAALSRGDFAHAEDLEQRAITIVPSMGSAWNNLGVARLKQRDYLGARDALLRAAELLPTDPRPYENLGHVHNEAGYDAEALQCFRESLGRDPNWLASLRGAARAQKYLLRSDEAGLEIVKRGLYIEKDPQWRHLFESERLRMEADLAEKAKAMHPSGL